MLSALFNQFTGLVGRPLLLCGVFPALLLMVFLTIYFTGSIDMESFGRVVLPQEGDKAPPSGTTLSEAIVVGAIAIVLAGARSIIFRFWQELPVPLLRSVALARQRWKSGRAERRRDLASWHLSVARWYVKPSVGPGQPSVDAWYEPKTKHPFASSKTPGELASVAEKGLVALEAVSNGKFYWGREKAAVRTGLRALYRVGAHNPNDQAYVDLLAGWRSQAADERALLVLDALAANAHEEWIAAMKACSSFPSRPWLRPTGLGNGLAALDDYAESRYGIDTSTLWSRVVPLLKNWERDDAANAQVAAEAAAVMATVFMALGGLFFLLPFAGYPPALKSTTVSDITITRWLPVVPVVFAWISYETAVFYVGAMRQRIEALVDLYRLSVIKALGYRAPRNVGEELRLLQQIGGHLVQSVAPDDHTPLSGDDSRSVASWS